MSKLISSENKKKKNKINKPTELFNKKVDLYTSNGGEYHIKKNRIYVCPSRYYGTLYTITSNKYNKDNVHIIKEFYPYDNSDRIRFLVLNLKGAKKFGSIEKTPDGRERRIAIIENYEEASEYVCSIGDINRIISDLNIEQKEIKKQPKVSKSEIKKLILTMDPKDNKKDKNKKRVA